MARTTGFTCTAVANLVADGIYKRIGISPPEYLGEHFDFVKKIFRTEKCNVIML